MTSQVSVALWLSSCERIVARRCQTSFNTSALHRCELIPADFKMDRWCQDRERKWRYHHACWEQNRSGRETVWQTLHNIISGVIYYEPGIDNMSGPCMSMLHQWSGISFLQANHNWGRRAESQRAERHVHRDQCQDRLQCQTGDPCSSPTFHHIWNTSLSLLVAVTPMCVYTTHINTTWLLQAHLLVCSSTISFSLFS